MDWIEKWWIEVAGGIVAIVFGASWAAGLMLFTNLAALFAFALIICSIRRESA